MQEIENVQKSNKVQEGDFVFAGLAQRDGAGFHGVVTKIENEIAFIRIAKTQFGDRIIKAHLDKVQHADIVEWWKDWK